MKSGERRTGANGTGGSTEDAGHKTIEVGLEDVLSRDEAELLAKTRNGELTCPWCEKPLSGEFLFHRLEGDHYYAGVRLSCNCGFVEY